MAPAAKDIRLVITASSLGTMFEWYDVYIYGTLPASGIIGRAFFPAGSELRAGQGDAVAMGYRADPGRDAEGIKD